ncbi:hypothetical protein V8G54_005794, partial [Vigna mungo]
MRKTLKGFVSIYINKQSNLSTTLAGSSVQALSLWFVRSFDFPSQRFSNSVFRNLFCRFSYLILHFLIVEMAKSKNHTAHNQSYKAHKNGIKKPKRHRHTST